MEDSTNSLPEHGDVNDIVGTEEASQIHHIQDEITTSNNNTDILLKALSDTPKIDSDIEVDINEVSTSTKTVPTDTKTDFSRSIDNVLMVTAFIALILLLCLHVGK